MQHFQIPLNLSYNGAPWYRSDLPTSLTCYEDTPEPHLLDLSQWVADDNEDPGELEFRVHSNSHEDVVDVAIAEWMPYLRASYEQADTTPRPFGSPPTITGTPFRCGLSLCSTEAKNASISTWMIHLFSAFAFGMELK